MECQGRAIQVSPRGPGATHPPGTSGSRTASLCAPTRTTLAGAAGTTLTRTPQPGGSAKLPMLAGQLTLVKTPVAGLRIATDIPGTAPNAVQRDFASGYNPA